MIELFGVLVLVMVRSRMTKCRYCEDGSSLWMNAGWRVVLLFYEPFFLRREEFGTGGNLAGALLIRVCVRMCLLVEIPPIRGTEPPQREAMKDLAPFDYDGQLPSKRPSLSSHDCIWTRANVVCFHGCYDTRRAMVFLAKNRILCFAFCQRWSVGW